MVSKCRSSYLGLNFWIKVGLPAVVMLHLLTTVACGGRASADPNGHLPEGQVSKTSNPLVAQYTVSPPAQAMVVIEFGPDTTYALHTSPQMTPENGGPLSILVAGMKQSTLYHMRAMVTYSDGTQEVDSDHTFQTSTIPPDRLPRITVTIPSGMRPAPGVELLSLTESNPNQLLTLATDPGGNIIWYYDYDIAVGFPQPIKLLPNGHMLMILYTTGVPGGTVREVDLAGNTIREFTYGNLAAKIQNAGYDVQVFSIDHDFVLLPNGHLLLLVTDYRIFKDLPGYPGETQVLGTAVVDLDPNENVAWVWDAFDHLDVNRHPMSFPDWTHGNALAYSADDGNLLLSLRHQSWVLKIDYQNGNGSGDILWKLGYQGDFELSSNNPSDWFYAQHDANIASPNSTGDFQLALFDNGDDRVVDSGGETCTIVPPCYSAAAIFDVNESTMTASREWSYMRPYSLWGGVTHVLPNSDVFVDETAPTDLNFTSARVSEVTQNANPAVVWQLVISGQNSYRTIHIPSLYPGVQW